MGKNFEIAENPEILVDRDFDPNQVQVIGLKLYDDYRRIPSVEIVGVGVEGYDDSLDNFTQRLEKLSQYNGWVRLAGQLSFRIENQRIVEIVIMKKWLGKLSKYNGEQIMSVYGNPTEVLTDSLTWVTDYVEYAKVLVYSEKKLYFFIDTHTKKVNEIRIGDVDRRRFS